jgi:Ca2+-binding EF-hand superfamily protein
MGRDYMDGHDFYQLMANKKRQYHERSEQETLKAFVAVGGNPDGSGCVESHKLIEILKNEFQMTLNIEKLLTEIDTDGSGEIEFDEFTELLNA